MQAHKEFRGFRAFVVMSARRGIRAVKGRKVISVLRDRRGQRDLPDQ